MVFISPSSPKVAGSAFAISLASNYPIGLKTHLQEKTTSINAIAYLVTIISLSGVDVMTYFFYRFFSQSLHS